MATEGFKRELAAVLTSDVTGYSWLIGDDEEATVRSIKVYRDVMANLVEGLGGRIADAKGDNILPGFSSVVDAVLCAVGIHASLWLCENGITTAGGMGSLGVNL